MKHKFLILIAPLILGSCDVIPSIKKSFVKRETIHDSHGESVLVKPMSAWDKRSLNGIKFFESFKRKRYTCPGGVGTIGYGCTKKYVVNKRTISREDAAFYLQKDYDEYAAHVDRIVTVPLSPYQRAALISFTYNCGPGALTTLVTGPDRLNSGNYKSVETILPQYRKGGGKVLKGLVKRRAWELTIWRAIKPIKIEEFSNDK